MTHIAHQNDAFYIQKKNARNADCAQQLNNQSVTQTLKYCDICDQTPAMPKILDSRIGCSVNNLDKRQSRSTKFAPRSAEFAARALGGLANVGAEQRFRPLQTAFNNILPEYVIIFVKSFVGSKIMPTFAPVKSCLHGCTT